MGDKILFYALKFNFHDYVRGEIKPFLGIFILFALRPDQIGV